MNKHVKYGKNLIKTHNYTSVQYLLDMQKHEIIVKVRFGDNKTFFLKKYTSVIKRLAYTLTAYCYGSKSVTQPDASSILEHCKR